MSETVSGSHYQRLHHMLSESSWSRAGVRRQLIADANVHFGYASALVIDESGFAKKGDMSAGVARQWNGRLGKTDNSQVGVFGAVTRNGVAALVDGDLYLPEHWVADAERCEAVGVPEGTQFRTKGEMAFAMIHRLRREGLHFAYTVFDGGYGHLPWLLSSLDDEGEVFMAEVHSDQAIYLADPCPTIPGRSTLKGKAPTLPVALVDSLKACQWAAVQPASAWRRLTMREGEKGKLIAEYLTRRVWLWDGAAPKARCWHLLVRRELDGSKLKCCLSNAKPNASLRHLASMQGARHFVERAFEDAKSSCGMADYQVRGWQAWHHHMALVMIALMFLAKERLAHQETDSLLSCNDLVQILRHKLPNKIVTDDDLVSTIQQRHQRRHDAMDSAYRRQEAALNASSLSGI